MPEDVWPFPKREGMDVVILGNNQPDVLRNQSLSSEDMLRTVNFYSIATTCMYSYKLYALRFPMS